MSAGGFAANAVIGEARQLLMGGVDAHVAKGFSLVLDVPRHHINDKDGRFQAVVDTPQKSFPLLQEGGGVAEGGDIPQGNNSPQNVSAIVNDGVTIHQHRTALV
jgi:hypothetical protein